MGLLLGFDTITSVEVAIKLVNKLKFIIQYGGQKKKSNKANAQAYMLEKDVLMKLKNEEGK